MFFPFAVFVLVFLHKIQLGLVPEYLKDVLIEFSQIHLHETRNKQNFALKHVNKKKTQKSIFFKGVIIYNHLEKKLKELPLKQFKMELRFFYFNKETI